MPGDLLFSLAAVSYSANAKTILNDISLTVQEGDFLALLGPSGAGKSTLLRLFNGLDSPHEGTIQFRGRPLLEYDLPILRKRVGMLFQAAVMVAGTVRDNLVLIQRWERPRPQLPTTQLEKALEQVGLDKNILSQEAQLLSGGEQQRLALARVLLNAPEVLLLDEPTSNLDPRLAQRILNRIDELRRRLDLTVILVTHQPPLARKYARRIVFLQAGQILEMGNRTILDNPASAELQDFLAEEE